MDGNLLGPGFPRPSRFSLRDALHPSPHRTPRFRNPPGWADPSNRNWVFKTDYFLPGLCLPRAGLRGPNVHAKILYVPDSKPSQQLKPGFLQRPVRPWRFFLTGAPAKPCLAHDAAPMNRLSCPNDQRGFLLVKKKSRSVGTLAGAGKSRLVG